MPCAYNCATCDKDYYCLSCNEDRYFNG